MSVFTFCKAKNGEETCQQQDRFFHSSYNPSREAQNFVNSLTCPFKPNVVIAIEPGLSYILPPLKERFPQAEFICISVCDQFDSLGKRTVTDSKGKTFSWDLIIPYTSDENLLAEKLYSFLGEEKLCTCLVASPKTSDDFFPNETGICWKAIKQTILKARDVLYTRSYFSQRWLKNTVKFISYSNHYLGLQSTQKDIIIAASGPSLQGSLPFIKKHRHSFYLIALSSGLSPLLSYGITPDLLLSTDGGFWAKKHINYPGLQNQVSSLVYALPCEAAISSTILQEHSIVPLTYDHSLGKELMDLCHIPYGLVMRNGTVSGTATCLALSLTNKNIYLCGVDLESVAGFQHTQPNQLDMENSTKSKRTRPEESRLVSSQFNSDASLAIYRSWFASESEKLNQRVFRLSHHYIFKNKLGSIKDTDWEEIHIKDTSDTEQLFFTCPEERKAADKISLMKEYIFNNVSSKKWVQELFPLESLLRDRSLDSEETEKYQKQLENKIETLKNDLEKLL